MDAIKLCLFKRYGKLQYREIYPLSHVSRHTLLKFWDPVEGGVVFFVYVCALRSWLMSGSPSRLGTIQQKGQGRIRVLGL